MVLFLCGSWVWLCLASSSRNKPRCARGSAPTHLTRTAPLRCPTAAREPTPKVPLRASLLKISHLFTSLPNFLLPLPLYFRRCGWAGGILVLDPLGDTLRVRLRMLTHCYVVVVGSGGKHKKKHKKTHSPSGKLVQIEYALNAVRGGSTSIGIKGMPPTRRFPQQSSSPLSLLSRSDILLHHPVACAAVIHTCAFHVAKSEPSSSRGMPSCGKTQSRAGPVEEGRGRERTLSLGV